MKKLIGIFAILFLCMMCGSIDAAEVNLQWTPNSETNLAGYKIYYGKATGDYDDIIDVNLPPITDEVIRISLSDFEDGITYYLAATAYDSDGFESDFSTEIMWTAPTEEIIKPNPVQNSTVIKVVQNLDGSTDIYIITADTNVRLVSRTMPDGKIYIFDENGRIIVPVE